MSATEWYEDHDELVATARWLERRCELDTVDDVIDFFAEPWKWTLEHDQMVSAMALGDGS